MLRRPRTSTTPSDGASPPRKAFLDGHLPPDLPWGLQPARRARFRRRTAAPLAGRVRALSLAFHSQTRRWGNPSRRTSVLPIAGKRRFQSTKTEGSAAAVLPSLSRAASLVPSLPRPARADLSQPPLDRVEADLGRPSDLAHREARLVKDRDFVAPHRVVHRVPPSSDEGEAAPPFRPHGAAPTWEVEVYR